MDPNTKLWSAFSEISTLIRTFTKEESTQRKTTYYEHALRMEKEQSAKMQTQITKLAQVYVYELNAVIYIKIGWDNLRISSSKNPICLMRWII